jgi:hypothetical protein
MTYTLVAYRSDGQRTCRGCVVDQWSSDFVHVYAISREELIKRVAELYAFDGKEKYEEVLWFEDKSEVVEDEEVYLGPDESIANEARFMATTIRNARKEKEDAAATAYQAAALEATRRTELEQLGRLKAKYGE